MKLIVERNLQQFKCTSWSCTSVADQRWKGLISKRSLYMLVDAVFWTVWLKKKGSIYQKCIGDTLFVYM